MVIHLRSQMMMNMIDTHSKASVWKTVHDKSQLEKLCT